jgi:hypothetical protein
MGWFGHCAWQGQYILLVYVVHFAWRGHLILLCLFNYHNSGCADQQDS